MKTVLLKISALLLAVCTLFSFFIFNSSAAGLAYNIYSNPVLPEGTNLFTTYMIDFSSDETPFYTFWALANFGLYKSRETKIRYKAITGGGGYAGLQDGARSEYPDGSYLRDENGKMVIGKIGIMSFWEMDYVIKKEHVKMTASALYPHSDSAFGGEGEGSHVMWPYEWDDDAWYTMLLHTWQDEETGTTFMGQWFRDVKTGEWTLHSYFDTHLINSCLEGGMGLFLENFSGSTQADYRSFKTKNLYAQDFKTGSWLSLDSCRISYGNGGTANKYGSHEFGATSEYFWGRSGGVVEDQDAYEAAATKEGVYRINQPSTPDFGGEQDFDMTVSCENGNVLVSWSGKATDAPQLSYEIRIVDKDGVTVAEKSQSRPEVRSSEVVNCSGKDCSCVLTVTDVFGRSVSKTVKIDGSDLKGDSDGDMILTVKDLAGAANAVGNASMAARFDLDGDGAVTEADVKALLTRLER